MGRHGRHWRGRGRARRYQDRIHAIIPVIARQQLVWRKRPQRDDYEAAAAFLSLQFRVADVKSLIRALRKAQVGEHSAKDILRASGLPLLPPDDPNVKEELKKIGKERPLSPILLVRGDMSKGIALIVADGYHRICAVYHDDEQAPIAMQIVDN